VSGVVILMYHRLGGGRLPEREEGEHLYALSPETFEAQLDLIQRSRCSPVPVEAVGGPAAAESRPPNPVAITFDDGNVSDRTVALPALLKRGLAAAFFVTPAWIGTPGYMDWPDVRELLARGMTVGAHGLDHTLLATLGEGELRSHLQEARGLMEARLGMAPASLALPGGSGGRREVRIAREAGFTQVLGSVPTLAPADPLDPIPRFAIRRGDSLATVRALVEQQKGVRLRFWLRHQALAGLLLALGPRRHARLRSAWAGLARDE
jgi:peptidoglycan/xylan/chitin deacetylase (PgdA/CDA1 family)